MKLRRVSEWIIIAYDEKIVGIGSLYASGILSSII